MGGMGFVAVLIVVLYTSLVGALDNGVGRTPAMGWNSWNTFRCNINESLVREVADAMVSSGLRDAGYQYVNIDDCWQEKREPDGRIVPFRNKFPSGMKALADYVHSKGLKFGLYSDTGNHTCEGYPGSWGHEEQDAKTYAEWGVDYLKYDYCDMSNTQVSVQASYTVMRDALNRTGRPILYSLCSWGTGSPHLWGSSVGNSWRTGIDLFAAWDQGHAQRLKLPSFLQSVLSAVRNEEGLHQYAGPGGFNDPDMLVVGLDGMYPYGIVQECPEHVKGCAPGQYISRDQWGSVGGLSYTEQRTHFSFWCMLASPLILGNDPRHMSHATIGILTSPEVLAISQDVMGKQAYKVWTSGGFEIWYKDLADGSAAVLLFNANSGAADIHVNWRRDAPALSAKWQRTLPEPSQGCQDTLPQCRGWAKAGECETNAGCPKWPSMSLNEAERHAEHADLLPGVPQGSCPAGCPPPADPPGPKATALVRDLWLQEDLGVFSSGYTAHLVEPHEGRLLRLTFGEQDVLLGKLRAGEQGGGSQARLVTSGRTRGSAVSQPRQGRRGTLGGSEGGAGGPDVLDFKQLKHQVAQLTADLERSHLEVARLGEQMKATQVQTTASLARASSEAKKAAAAAVAAAAGSRPRAGAEQQEQQQQVPAPASTLAAQSQKEGRLTGKRAGQQVLLNEEEQQEQQELTRLGRHERLMQNRAANGSAGGEGSGRAWGGVVLFALGCLVGGTVVGVAAAVRSSKRVPVMLRTPRVTTHAD